MSSWPGKLVTGSFVSGLMCWHREPAYPHHVGGLDIYTAVLDDGIRILDQFAAWLAQRPEQTGGPAE